MVASGTSDADVAELPRSARAAILLMALGEEEAAGVLRYLEPTEMQLLGEAMSGMNGISQERIGATLSEFVEHVRHESSLGLDSARWFRSTLIRAVGEEKAKGVLSRMPGGEGGLSGLKWMEASVIARMLRSEHPQTVATVLSQLPPAKAGEVLDGLPPGGHADIIMRVSRLDTLHPAALAELDEIIEQLFAEDADVELSGVGGVQSASEILNGVSKQAETSILEAIESVDRDLATGLREGMFVFENLNEVSDRGMQLLLRDVPGEKLVLALKGCSAMLSDKVFRNMSSRAADILRDDLAAKGPVRLSEVESSQHEILRIAKRLAEEGKLALSSKDDEYV